jgi:hypothetical protein
MVRQGIALIPFHERQQDGSIRSYLAGTVVDPSLPNERRAEIEQLVGALTSGPLRSAALIGELGDVELVTFALYLVNATHNNPMLVPLMRRLLTAKVQPVEGMS